MFIPIVKVPERDDPQLESPITPDELAWWREERRSPRNGYMLAMGAPMLVMMVITAWVVKGIANVPAWKLLSFVALAVGIAIGTWHSHENRFRTQAVRWKRIRDDLAATNEGAPGPAE